MNNIDRPGGGLGRGAEYLTQNSFGRGINDKRGPETDLLDRDSLELDDETSETSSTATGRQAEFIKSFRAAVRGFKEKGSEKERDSDDQTPDLRTLAVAEQRLLTGLPVPASDASDPTEGVSSTEATIATIAETVDRLIRAEMAPKDGAPLAIKISFFDENLGLSGLQVIVTPTTLDVIFERTGAAPSDGLIRAAQALAERLMTRFSKKTVRILDTTATDDPAEREQLDEAAIAAPFKPFL